jgi:glycosyltransferase involved in cell wall biosynthesis
VVLDLDDHDEALSREFRERSLANRLRLHPLRMLHPNRVRQTRLAAVRAADALTCSSEALARALCLPASKPRLRVAHPRPAGGDAPRVEALDGRVHAGCLGTLREHKGLGVLGSLLERDSSLVLHVFDPAPPPLLRYGEQVVAHAPATPLSRIYARLDVALLPQGDSPGARVQVPAKLLDSLRFGVPVLASATPAIEEIAGDAYRAVTDWGNLDAVLEQLRACAAERETIGAKGRARFERELSLDAQVQPFETFIAETTRLASSGRGVPEP